MAGQSRAPWPVTSGLDDSTRGPTGVDRGHRAWRHPAAMLVSGMPTAMRSRSGGEPEDREKQPARLLANGHLAEFNFPAEVGEGLPPDLGLEAFGPAVEAAAGLNTIRSKSGKNARPSVSIKPTKIAATIAPRIEPMPPMTVMTKARIRMFSPIPICTVRIGACISPARPASAAPSPNTSVYSSLMFTPSAPTISRLLAPARINIPMRVRMTST